MWATPRAARVRSRPPNWKLFAYVLAAAAVVAVGFVGIAMLVELRKPAEWVQGGEAKPDDPTGRCADAIAGLKAARAKGVQASPEIRERLRVCLGR